MIDRYRVDHERNLVQKILSRRDRSVRNRLTNKRCLAVFDREAAGDIATAVPGAYYGVEGLLGPDDHSRRESPKPRHGPRKVVEVRRSVTHDSIRSIPAHVAVPSEMSTRVGGTRKRYYTVYRGEDEGAHLSGEGGRVPAV